MNEQRKRSDITGEYTLLTLVYETSCSHWPRRPGVHRSSLQLPPVNRAQRWRTTLGLIAQLLPAVHWFATAVWFSAPLALLSAWEKRKSKQFIFL